MQVTKGTWHMCKQCVPGSFPPPSYKSQGTRLSRDQPDIPTENHVWLDSGAFLY